MQECEVAVRSRTEALADWYKAGKQLVYFFETPQKMFFTQEVILLS